MVGKVKIAEKLIATLNEFSMGKEEDATLETKGHELLINGELHDVAVTSKAGFIGNRIPVEVHVNKKGSYDSDSDKGYYYLSDDTISVMGMSLDVTFKSDDMHVFRTGKINGVLKIIKDIN